MTKNTLKPAAHRRNASALILVIMVLGVLFVTGVTFLATMNFESQLISFEREAKKSDLAVDLVSDLVNVVMHDTVVDAQGEFGKSSSLGAMVQVPDPVFKPQSQALVHLPLVHGLASRIEPEWYFNEYDNLNAWQMVYRQPTNLSLLLKGPTASDRYSNDRFIYTAKSIGSQNRTYWTPPKAQLDVLVPPVNPIIDPVQPSPTVVDADGDGIVDSFQVDLADLGFSQAQISEVSSIVNVAANPKGKVYAGLRIIPHGGMVNVAEGHPNLIASILPPLGWYAQEWRERPVPYSPLVEEAALRRRGILPSRVLPPTTIQGNPFLSVPESIYPEVPGSGHFAFHLFPRSSLFRSTGESVLTGDHRYWPYSTTNQNDEYGLEWAERMNPNNDAQYDRRHLITSVSYDDLIAPSVTIPVEGVEEPMDFVEAVSRINMLGPNGETAPLLFEIADYPQRIPSGKKDSAQAWWDCYYCYLNPKDPNCNECAPDPLKGHIKLSLPQLDKDLADGYLTGAKRNNLIYNFFTMLLLNARGPEWGSYVDVDGDPLTPERVWVWSDPHLRHIAHAAAALTANLIDFADSDDIPTAIPVRSLDFVPSAPPIPNPPLPAPGIPTSEVVYGLEKQLYITEVAAGLLRGADRAEENRKSWFAVELFNPHDSEISTSDNGRYSIQVNNDQPIDLPTSVNITSKEFYTILKETEVDDPVNCPVPQPSGNVLKDAGLVFRNDDVIYLLLKIDGVDVVVDEFRVFGMPDPEDVMVCKPYSIYRPGVERLEPWYASIPAGANDTSPSETIGRPNSGSPPSNLRPVPVVFANNGNGGLADAFPTTGSLLMLMRYGNYPIRDTQGNLILNKGAVDKNGNFAGTYAFTARLAQEWTSMDGNSTIKANEQIDNGRMPIFDTGNVQHVPPDLNPEVFDSATGGFASWPHERPGERYHLPWGQFVFDYFTALPLDNPSPYNPGWNIPLDYKPPWNVKPRVEENGFRVHGRIDLNAAPWSVLKGLPLVRLDSWDTANGSPEFVGDLITGTGNAADVETSIDLRLAQAIVSYREAQEVRGVVNNQPYVPLPVGNYGWSGTESRGWTEGAALLKYRRGTGFLTVGELANLRQDSFNAVNQNGDTQLNLNVVNEAKIDGGVVGQGTYEERFTVAAATLIALSDWVTVRSQVFTVYGVLRGDGTTVQGIDQKELDDRAIRFQETIDRLPTIRGRKTPARIGQRTFGRYNDFRND